MHHLGTRDELLRDGTVLTDIRRCGTRRSSYGLLTRAEEEALVRGLEETMTRRGKELQAAKEDQESNVCR